MDDDLQTQREAFDRMARRVSYFADAFWLAVRVSLIYGAVAIVCKLVSAYYRWAGA